MKSHVAVFLFNYEAAESNDSLRELDEELKKSISLIKHIGDGKFDIDYPGMTAELKELNQENLSGELQALWLPEKISSQRGEKETLLLQSNEIYP